MYGCLDYMNMTEETNIYIRIVVHFYPVTGYCLMQLQKLTVMFAKMVVTATV